MLNASLSIRIFFHNLSLAKIYMISFPTSLLVVPLSETRRTAARSFFSLLVLEKKACVKTTQQESFQQIKIKIQDQVSRVA